MLFRQVVVTLVWHARQRIVTNAGLLRNKPCRKRDIFGPLGTAVEPAISVLVELYRISKPKRPVETLQRTESRPRVAFGTLLGMHPFRNAQWCLTGFGQQSIYLQRRRADPCRTRRVLLELQGAKLVAKQA